MMFRNGWGTKEMQETTLAIRLKRIAFDLILSEAVPSTYSNERYPAVAAWKQALASSAVRLQWDPDHHPSGAKIERRAIQLGLRGPTLEQYAHDWIIDIEDISDFVREQREHMLARDYSQLLIPQEREYRTHYQHIAVSEMDQSHKEN
jgi:hypothetical protein